MLSKRIKPPNDVPLKSVEPGNSPATTPKKEYAFTTARFSPIPTKITSQTKLISSPAAYQPFVLKLQWEEFRWDHHRRLFFHDPSKEHDWTTVLPP